MKTLIRQEMYKLIKQRSNKIFFIGLFVFQLLVALCSVKYPKFLAAKDAFRTSYLAFIPITFIGICSTLITKEHQYGTLRSLLYRRFSYVQVIISKIISMMTFTIVIFLSSSIVSLIFKFIFFSHLTLTKKMLEDWLLKDFNQFLTLVFLMSLVILLSTLINNSNLALTIGIVGYFVVNVFNQMLLMLVAKFDWLKWNPLNMMNFGEQLQNSDFHKLTQLSLPQISIGYVVYVVLFIGLAVYSFCKKAV